MNGKKFAIELIRRLQSVDDTCITCAHNPKTYVCTDIGNTKICYKGIKAFMEKELNNGKTPKD